jgi:hypothetical protein
MEILWRVFIQCTKRNSCTLDEYNRQRAKQIMSETTKLKRTSQTPAKISRSTIKIQTISQRNQMTSSTNIKTINQSNEITLSTCLLMTSHISENEEIKHSEPKMRKNKWYIKF